MSGVKFSPCGQWPVRLRLQAGYRPVLKSESQTRSPAVLHWAHPDCLLASHWEMSQGRDSDDWQWQWRPFYLGWQRGVVREEMCNRTGCRAVCGGEDQRSPAGWGWIDSQVEKQGEAGNRILHPRTLMDLWEGGTALGGCCNDGGGVWVGCRCSQAGWEGKPGKARSTGMWRVGETMLQALHELLGLLQKQRQKNREVKPTSTCLRQSSWEQWQHLIFVQMPETTGDASILNLILVWPIHMQYWFFVNVLRKFNVSAINDSFHH